MSLSNNTLEAVSQNSNTSSQSEIVHTFYLSKAFFWRNAAMLLLMVFYCAISLIFKINALFSNMLSVTILILCSCYSIFNLMSCRYPYVIFGKNFIQVSSRRIGFEQIAFLDNQAKNHFLIHFRDQSQQGTKAYQDLKAYIFWRRLTPDDQRELRLLLEKLIYDRANSAS